MTEKGKQVYDRIHKKSVSLKAFIDAIADELLLMKRCNESELRERLAGVSESIRQHQKAREEIARVHKLNYPSQSAKK